VSSDWLLEPRVYGLALTSWGAADDVDDLRALLPADNDVANVVVAATASEYLVPL